MIAHIYTNKENIYHNIIEIKVLAKHLVLETLRDTHYIPIHTIEHIELIPQEVA